MREKRVPRSARPADTKPRYKDKDAVLGRIVGELAGTVSVCWSPRPEGVFDSSIASDAVNRALKEIDERFVLVLRTDHPANLATDPGYDR